MLRGRPGSPPSATAFPSFDEPYALADRPAGVQFYHSEQSFFLPYALLAGMRWTAERLALNFTTEEVVIEGRGLHELYVRLAEHRVVRICEQGERYEQTNAETVYVRRIRRVPHVAAGVAAPDPDDDLFRRLNTEAE